MKLSLIIEAIARGRGIEQSRRGLRAMDRDARTAAGGLGQVDRRQRTAAGSSRQLERAAYRTGHALGAMTRRGVAGLAALDRRLQLSRKQLVGFAEWSGGKLGTMLRYGATAAAGGVMAGLYKIVSTGLQFEKYRTQLRGLEGSAAAGQRAMDWVSEFAKTTPYELADVMEAFVALKAYGIDPTDGSLRSLGDTAAGMGKGLMQAVEMIADAQTGEFERLKEFGVRASSAGEKVTFKFVRNGREMTRTVKKDAGEIQRALRSIFDERFAGGMDRMAQTTAGKWSNLMDRFSTTANRVWEGGLGASVNRELDRLSNAIGRAEQDGSLKRWADQTSQALGNFVKTIGSTDWNEVAGGILTVARAIDSAAGALQRLDQARKSMNDWITWSRESLGGVQVVPGGLRYVPPSQMPSRQRTAPAAAPRSRQQPYSDAFESGADWKRRPPRQAPAAAPRPAKAPAPGNAKISLHVTTDKGVTARPTAVAARGVDVDVATGRAMRGAA